jgi:hypothetical protein
MERVVFVPLRLGATDALLNVAEVAPVGSGPSTLRLTALPKFVLRFGVF